MQPPWPRHGACAALARRPGRLLSGPLPTSQNGNTKQKGDGAWVVLLARQLARCNRATRARASAPQRELVTCLPVGT
eukprot:6174290-Pleurochrysis_carterae.AAC.2